MKVCCWLLAAHCSWWLPKTVSLICQLLHFGVFVTSPFYIQVHRHPNLVRACIPCWLCAIVAPLRWPWFITKKRVSRTFEPQAYDVNEDSQWLLTRTNRMPLGNISSKDGRGKSLIEMKDQAEILNGKWREVARSKPIFCTYFSSSDSRRGTMATGKFIVKC